MKHVYLYFYLCDDFFSRSSILKIYLLLTLQQIPRKFLNLQSKLMKKNLIYIFYLSSIVLAYFEIQYFVIFIEIFKEKSNITLRLVRG